MEVLTEDQRQREAVDKKEVRCFHCGDSCDSRPIVVSDKSFCCEGCKLVYELLEEKGLCTYYDLSEKPGLNRKKSSEQSRSFAFLDDDEVKKKLVTFTDGEQTHVTFWIPQMHCSSCIWLLENLPKLQEGVIRSQVNFPKKEVQIVFSERKSSLRQLADLLASIGYEPYISLNDLNKRPVSKANRSQIYKIGIAGFCFGNIMMLSFPDYLSSGNIGDKQLVHLFGYLSLLLSLPVFFYSASDFFISAWKGLSRRFLNIDAPIALAVLVTFVRSVVDILAGSGPGFMDSMSGIVFFMLLGRYFQNITYQNLSFERDYKSFFPIAVSVFVKGKEVQTPLSKLKKNDIILVRNRELVPADTVLLSESAFIDYSFVTGESTPVLKYKGEFVYAGGLLNNGSALLQVVKETSHSYLTGLWNNSVFREKQNETDHFSFVHVLSRYFALVTFIVAFSAAFFWMWQGNNYHALNSFTAVLIIACPCALLLSATFTFGNVLRLMGRGGFYLKNARVVEKIADANTIVFDKTGTITLGAKHSLGYAGDRLNDEEKTLIQAVTSRSSHPLSRIISTYLPAAASIKVESFMEIPGKGIEGVVGENKVKVGSASFVQLTESAGQSVGTNVYVQINEEIKGSFVFSNSYRTELAQVIRSLKKHYHLYLLSGDNDSERETLKEFFGDDRNLHFYQSPSDKLNFISKLRSEGRKVIMIGDGLNDAAALAKSDVGIAVSDNVNNFTPACDAILEGSRFGLLNNLFGFSRRAKKVIWGSFLLSIIYNLIGIWFSVQGNLSPVIAAILMPASTITIVLFTTLGSTLWAKVNRID